MVEIKIVIGYKGESYQKTISDELIGKKISDKISGDLIGLKGYELEITGGSDTAGFPMRRDIPGIGRKKPLLTRGPGVHIDIKGERIRKTVRGNTISNDTAQINLKVLKVGSEDLGKLFKKKEPIKEQEKTKEVKK